MTINPIHSKSLSALSVLAVTLAGFAGACRRSSDTEVATAAAPPVTRVSGTVYTVRDTTLQAVFEAAGVAAPVQQATLSTKLMGTVTEVLAKEGDAVTQGQPLVRIDARDLSAKSAQVAAAVTGAVAIHRDAVTQEKRIRALYADSAATRAQLDAVEMALARAEAALRAANAESSELGAVSSYAVVRAPFAGVVTKRFVDPGAFAAPGAPLIAVQDGRQLRVTASATPEVTRGLRRGQPLQATVEGRPVGAIVEGIVPTAGNLYAINAVIANAAGHILPGSAATLRLPLGAHQALVVPAATVSRQGDLTGVTVRTAQGDERRWVRLGAATGDVVEVNAGLRIGDRVVVPVAGTSTTAARD